MNASRADKQVQAVAALLLTLTDKQLDDVLVKVGATRATSAGPRHRGRPCGICGLIYPDHMRRWADDHPFEDPRKRQDSHGA